MSAPFVVVIGVITETENGVMILTLAGDTIHVRKDAVVRSVGVDAAAADVKRIFLARDAEISIVTHAAAIRGIPTDTMTIMKSDDDGGTITKYVDDGGTISKTRDDLYSGCNI